MQSYQLATIVFACVFTGSLLGLSLNRWLPEHHRSPASHDAIKLGTGMISVLASLVLGLMTASIKTSFDATDGQIRSFAATLIQLDQTLRDYGPEAGKARELVRDYTTRSIRDHWPQESDAPVRMENADSGRVLAAARIAIIALPGDTPAQSSLRSSALSLIDTAMQTRWLLIERSESSIQPAFLIVLVVWIVLIFVSFGFNAPFNATVITAFLICAGALSTCLFVMVEMDTPFEGFITVSSHPMWDALAHMRP
jgi:Protein of unknown function (DUF4239)